MSNDQMTKAVGKPADIVSRDAAMRSAVIFGRGLAGGIIGGITGYFLFHWLATRGALGYAIPAALLGLGAGLSAGGRSWPLGVACAVAGLCLTLFAEWVHAPFRNDGSFSYFLTHLHRLDHLPMKAIITALGVACAYWLGQGR